MNTSMCMYLLGTLALAPLLHADLVTYGFFGTASGSLGTQAFSGATLSVTGLRTPRI